MAQLDGFERQIAAAGKAMQHGREGALPAFLLQNPRHVGVAVARMDDQRQPGFARRGNVLAQALRLRLARRIVVVIVEPGLADRHDLRMFRQRDQRLGVDVQFLMGVVRMGADRAENLRKFLCDRKHLRKFPHAGADGDHAADAGGAGARHHGVEFAGEIGKIEVAVAVDEHFQAFASGFDIAREHRRRRRQRDAGGDALVAVELGRSYVASRGIASRSSSFAAESGMTGCARIATWRRTSAVT